MLSNTALGGLCGALSNCFLTLPFTEASFKSPVNKRKLHHGFEWIMQQFLQHSAAMEEQQFMIQRCSDSHTCSHRPGFVHCWSSQEFFPSSWRLECGEGYYSADLSMALDEWVCPSWDVKGTGSHLVLCNLRDGCTWKSFSQQSVQEHSEQSWSLQAAFLPLELLSFIAAPIWDVKTRKEQQSQLQNSISWKSLWRENHSIMQHYGYARYEVTAPKV